MTLRQRLQQQSILTAPGVYDAFSALMVERAGFEAAYLSGASIAYTRLGRPDIGLVSFGEVRDVLSAISERVSIPIIADADTGFGNALNTMRTVKELERCGASAIQLEDQTSPKRCGHLDGKEVIPCAEMVGKLKAALDARRSAETLIVARTDAAAVEGIEAAFDRAEQYVEAGADVLFVEALRTLEEMQAAAQRFGGRVPLLANMVEGGKTPLTRVSELEAMGYRIAIFPGGTTRAVAFALDQYFATLRSEGGNAGNRDRMLDFKGLNDLIGTPAMIAVGRSYEA